MHNPWIRGYKVAFTYPSVKLDSVKRIDNELSKEIKRDDIFLANLPIYQSRLNGERLGNVIERIYSESDVVVAIFEKEFSNTDWEKWQLKHVLRSSQVGTRILLIKEHGAQVPKWLQYCPWYEFDLDDIPSIVRKIKKEIGEEDEQDVLTIGEEDEQDVLTIGEEDEQDVLTNR